MRPRAGQPDAIRVGLAVSGTASRLAAPLLEAGVSARSRSKQRVRSGPLLVEYRGVYRVGHRAPSREARYAAAWRRVARARCCVGRPPRTCTALVRGSAPPPRGDGAGANGALRASLPAAVDAWTRRTRRRFSRIPVTTVARTLSISPRCSASTRWRARATRRVFCMARRRRTWRQCSSADRPALARRSFGESCTATSTSHSARSNAASSRSSRAEGLPLPVTNRVAGGRRVDCRWPEHRLTIELDGYRYHRSRHAWEQDRRREREARARGDEFRRYTYGDVLEDPRFMLPELRDSSQGPSCLGVARRRREQDNPSLGVPVRRPARVDHALVLRAARRSSRGRRR